MALLDKRDAHHSFVDEKMRILAPPFYTCEAVVTECFFLLQHIPQSIEKLAAFMETGKIKIPSGYRNHVKNIHRLIKQYTYIPMSFADACLVHMAETTRRANIFTLDRDFTVYRPLKATPFH